MRQVLRWGCVPRHILGLAIIGVLLHWLAAYRRWASVRTRPGGHHDTGQA